MGISEKELSEVLEKINLAVVVCRVDTSICSCNDEALRLLGYSKEEIIGKKISELQLHCLQKDGNPLSVGELPVHRVLKDGRPITDMIVGIRKDHSDQIVWTAVNIQPDFAEDGINRRVIISFTDITDSHERRKVDKQIQQAKEEWENTVDAIRDIVIILDREMCIVRANKAAYSLSGLGFGALNGKKCFKVLYGRSDCCEGCPSWKPGAVPTFCTGLIHDKKSNKIFEVSSAPIVDETGKVKFLVNTMRDVTQNLYDELERKRLYTAVEQISESVIITNTIGDIEYVNPAFSRITGYAQTEVIGKNPRILKSGEHDEDFFRKMWDTILQGGVWSGRITNRKKDGTLFKEDQTISPLYNEEGTITNFVAVNHDITKEESLERQLQHAIKMEAIGTLAGGIAHDFNNILSALIGYGQIAKGRIHADDPVQSDIDQVLLAADRAVDLVKQILTFSRQDPSEKFKPLQIQFLTKEVLKLLRSTLPTTIELKYSIQSDCSPVLADSSQIHQVLMNLCTNAKQAIGGGYGRITVNLSEVQITEKNIGDMLPLQKLGNYIYLEVTDSGCGMDQKLMERIFDPFFSTKIKDHGTGLGLAVVHGIVKKHGGEIFVDSTLGEGSTFRIYFPAQQLEMDTPTVATESEYGGSERIMVVDDEETIAKLFQRILSRLGYRVTVFTNSIEAVSQYRKNPDDYDLIITDMTMPQMTGAELAREILTLRPGKPVIITTGFSESIDKEKAGRIGIKEFLLKPVKKEQLSHAVRRVFSHG
jgi:PAS domain S-box-containing protein